MYRNMIKCSIMDARHIWCELRIHFIMRMSPMGDPGGVGNRNFCLNKYCCTKGDGNLYVCKEIYFKLQSRNYFRLQSRVQSNNKSIIGFNKSKRL